MVNALYYGGLTQEEAARVLGISVRTLKRRWHSARLTLYEALTSCRKRNLTMICWPICSCGGKNCMDKDRMFPPRSCVETVHTLSAN